MMTRTRSAPSPLLTLLNKSAEALRMGFRIGSNCARERGAKGSDAETVRASTRQRQTAVRRIKLVPSEKKAASAPVQIKSRSDARGNGLGVSLVGSLRCRANRKPRMGDSGESGL